MAGDLLPLLSSAVALVGALQRREVRSVDVTRAFLDRIVAGNRRVRCVSRLEADSALRQAAEADQLADAGGALGPLHGLPMTLKDGYRVAGFRSTYGLPYLHFHRQKADCEAVARLRRAGAVFLGRTAVPFACFDWQYKPPLGLGRKCVNPLDPAHTPGGSSSGAAAALAAGFTPLELGSDMAGSIRYPAHCCGVWGLRTTIGLVPAGDIGPDGGPLTPSATVLGPMARSADDLALLLSVLAPESDPRVPALPPGKPRVAVTRFVPGLPVDPQTAAAIESVVQRARAAGCEIVEAEPPFDFDEAYDLWGLLGGYELRAALPFVMRNRLAIRAFAAWFLYYRLGNGPLSVSLKRGMLASEAEYRDGLARRDERIARVDRFLVDHPLWVLPTSPMPAIRRQRSGRPIRFEGSDVSYSRFLGGYLCPTTLIGTPAAVVPVKPPGGGLPVGVQVHARRFTDHWLVRVLGSLLPDTAAAPATSSGSSGTPL